MKSMRSGWLRNAFALAVLLNCQRGAMATTPDGQLKTTGQQLKTINIVPDFLRFWDETRSDDEASCVRRFRQTVVAPHPQLFKGNVVPLFNLSRTADQDRGIAEYLKKVAPFVPAIRVLNLRLAQDLTAYDQEFLNVWPDFSADEPVYFTISMGTFDGAVRNVNGSNALLFGVDLIARLYGSTANLSVLFDHELFHVYHRQVAPSLFEGDEIWKSLWIEGLAEYVSWRMNPASTEDDVLLSTELRSKGIPLLPCLSASINRVLNSTDGSDYARYFLSGQAGADPPRAGYLVGFEVVSRMGERRSLAKLSRLSGEGLRQEIVGTLGELAGTAICTK